MYHAELAVARTRLFFENPNACAAFLGAAIILASTFAMRRTRFGRRSELLTTGVLFVLSVLLASTGSRGGFVAALLSAVMCAATVRQSFYLLLIPLILAPVGFVHGFGSRFHHLAAGDASASNRLYLWNACSTLTTVAPFAGSIKTNQDFDTLINGIVYQGPVEVPAYKSCLNGALDIAVRYGLPAFAAVFTIVGVIASAHVSIYKRSHIATDITVAGAMMVLLISSLLSDIFVGVNAAIFMICLCYSIVRVGQYWGHIWRRLCYAAFAFGIVGVCVSVLIFSVPPVLSLATPKHIILAEESDETLVQVESGRGREECVNVVMMKEDEGSIWGKAAQRFVDHYNPAKCTFHFLIRISPDLAGKFDPIAPSRHLWIFIGNASRLLSLMILPPNSRVMIIDFPINLPIPEGNLISPLSKGLWPLALVSLDKEVEAEIVQLRNERLAQHNSKNVWFVYTAENSVKSAIKSLTAAASNLHLP